MRGQPLYRPPADTWMALEKEQRRGIFLQSYGMMEKIRIRNLGKASLSLSRREEAVWRHGDRNDGPRSKRSNSSGLAFWNMQTHDPGVGRSGRNLQYSNAKNASLR